MQNWNRWNKDDKYDLSEQIEVIYIDKDNQVCLKIENTTEVEWHRTENVILGWRAVLKPKSVKVAEETPKSIPVVRYWNYVTGKFWPAHRGPPDTKLPYYFKLTMCIVNGKIDTQYELHSTF